MGCWVEVGREPNQVVYQFGPDNGTWNLFHQTARAVVVSQTVDPAANPVRVK
jgi:hypothetical protein